MKKLPQVSPNSQNRDRLNAIVEEHKAILFDYDKDGILLVRQGGHEIHHLVDFSEEQIEAARQFIVSSHQSSDICDLPIVKHIQDGHFRDLTKNENLFIKMKSRLILEVEESIFSFPEEASILFQKIHLEAELSDVVLRFQFSIPVASWSERLELTMKYLLEPIKNGTVQLILSGPFAVISDQDRRFFIDHGVCIEFVHDIVKDSFGFSEETRSVVSHLAEMGFRVPFIWYVDDRTVDNILFLIDEAMFLNYHSGFSLPTFQYDLTLTHPSPASLSYSRYLGLLVSVYERYRFYDDVISPFNYILYKSLKPGCRNFIRHEYYDRSQRKVKAFFQTLTMQKIESFLLRSFLWQRWKIIERG